MGFVGCCCCCGWMVRGRLVSTHGHLSEFFVVQLDFVVTFERLIAHTRLDTEQKQVDRRTGLSSYPGGFRLVRGRSD